MPEFQFDTGLYPLTFPSAIGPVQVTIGADWQQVVNRSPFTNATQIQRWPGDMLRLSIDLPPLTQDQARQFIAFGLALDGMRGTFTFGDPLRTSPVGTAATPSYGRVATANMTGKVLPTTGWTASQAILFEAGDYIQIGNRLYIVVKRASSDLAGNASLYIFPRLRESPALNTPVITSNTTGIWRLADSNFDWSFSASRMYSIKFAAVEAL